MFAGILSTEERQALQRPGFIFTSLLHYLFISVLLSCPAGIAAGLAQIIFHVGNVLLHLRDLLFLRGNLGVLVSDVLAAVLLAQGLLWVVVILDLGLLRFALQNVEFLLGLR